MIGPGWRVGRVDLEGAPARVVVQHVSGWRIDWTEGSRLAEIATPAGDLVDAVQAVGWEWVPAEGGSSRAVGPPPTPEHLAGLLAEWVAGNADALGLPALSGP